MLGHNPFLPDNLNRLQICFKPPPPKDMLCHVYMVCVHAVNFFSPFLFDLSIIGIPRPPTPCIQYVVALQICVAERANIQPCLLERLIACCEGDIRKAIMHLQFWCQGKSSGKGLLYYMHAGYF